MAKIPSALNEAAALALAYKARDPRPHQAVMEAYADLTPRRLKAVADSLWLIVEHPEVDAGDALQCYFVMELLAVQSWLL